MTVRRVERSRAAATSEAVRFAIVGTGVAARYHAQAIAAHRAARLVAVCRDDASRASAAAAEFGVRCETDYRRLLDRSDVDAVCICTPSGQHGEQAVAAARAGKHVLLEKPMALTLADADAAVAAARTAGVRLGVSFQRRTEPGYQALHEAIAEGALGRLVLGAATVPYYRGPEYFASAAWRGTWAMDGGGVLMNQGIHLADLLVWLLGEVEEVHATATTAVRDIEVEDCLAATLRFASGARGAFVGTTAAAPGFPHRLEVYGERGGAQVEGDVVVRWEAGERRPPVASGPVSAGAGASATSLAPTGHARILADFVEAVREGRDPMVTGEDGRRSLALVLAIYEAARTGRAVTPAPFGRANLSARRGDRASRRGPNRSRRRRGAPSR